MLDVVLAVAGTRDATTVQVSLAWLLAKEVVDAPIVGPKRIGHPDFKYGDGTIDPVT